MLLGELWEEAHQKHRQATETNDLNALREVEESYRMLLNEAPDELSIIFGLGTIEMQLGYNGLAINLLKHCLTIKEMPEVYNNLGTAYRSEGHYEEAEKCWRKALSMKDDPDYYNNMTTLYINQGCPKKGIPWAERGLKRDPGHSRMHWNHALLLLEQGLWKEGFAEYDWGLQSMDRPTRVYSNPPEKIPFWNGEKGKTVVVYGEQGMGDEIMFASCIPDLMKDCKEVIFDCHPRMLDLMKRSFGITCYGTRKKNTIDWPKNEKLDYRVAIGSLFKWYRSDGNFPKTPYLVPDEKLTTQYRKKIEALGPGPYIGVGWRGGTKGTNTSERSIKLSNLMPVYEQGGTFISLQYRDENGKTERFRKDTGVDIHHFPEVVEVGPDNSYIGFNYDHTVALINALDLCILPNTAAVHVCGAIGKECWTLTPDACAWRYQFNREDMPMYSSVRQFRGSGAIERIAQEYRNRWARPELDTASGG
jgi:tetratricopeptide (TPR) repeat protein